MIRRSAVIEQERRDLALVDARPEIRVVGDEKRFIGHAAVFNQRTAIGNPLKWGFYEEIAPGAFSKTLPEGDCRMLLDHDSFYVVSRKSAGTLNLSQDGIGLAVDSALDEEISYVRDLKANIRNGNISGMSFGFYVVKDEWRTENRTLDDGTMAEVEIRVIQEVRLIEVSAVTFPAYEQTDAGLREVTRALVHRGDEDAIRRRVAFRPELAALLDEGNGNGGTKEGRDMAKDDHVDSVVEEPGETTPSERTDVDDVSTEPGETTRVRPSDAELTSARLKFLRSQLRKVA